MPCRVLLLCLAMLCLQAGTPQFQKIGKGPGVLLIHGFGGNKEVWAGVAAELSRDHTVISVDLPGSGGTPGPATVAQFGFKGLPAFRIIHFPGARHWIMWDAPEAFLVAVRAFEAGLGR